MKSRYMNIDLKNLKLFFKSFKAEYANCNDGIKELHIGLREYNDRINVMYTWWIISKVFAVCTGVSLLFSTFFGFAAIYVLAAILIVSSILLTNVFNNFIEKEENMLEYNVWFKKYKLFSITYSWIKLARFLEIITGLALILSVYFGSIFIIISTALMFIRFVVLTYNIKEKLDGNYRGMMFVESFIENNYEFPKF